MPSEIAGDPELFIRLAKGRAGSAHKLYPVQDRKYKTVRGYGGVEGHIKRDGAAVEFEVDKSYCRDYWVPTLQKTMQQALKSVRAYNGQHTLSSQPTIRMSETYLRGAPADVSEFGCNPDVDAYTMQSKQPVIPQGHRLRYSGGHIHFNMSLVTGDARWSTASRITAVTDEKELARLQAAAALLCDATLGIFSVLALGELHDPQGERDRRLFYGQAGSYRPKKYGIEYRTLSSRGMLLHPSMTYWHTGVGRQIVNQKDPVAIVKEKVKPLFPLIQEAINNHNVEVADRVWNDLSVGLLKSMSGNTGESTSINRYIMFANVVNAAAKRGVSWTGDIVVDWHLNVQTPYSLDHNFWGVDRCMAGEVDEYLFPQQTVEKVRKADRFYLHPVLNPEYSVDKYVEGATW